VKSEVPKGKARRAGATSGEKKNKEFYAAGMESIEDAAKSEKKVEGATSG
jgi:hypothetical protein